MNNDKDKTLNSKIEELSRVFSLRIAEKIEKKQISVQASSNKLVKFTSALESKNIEEMNEIINCI